MSRHITFRARLDQTLYSQLAETQQNPPGARPCQQWPQEWKEVPSSGEYLFRGGGLLSLFTEIYQFSSSIFIILTGG